MLAWYFLPSSATFRGRCVNRTLVFLFGVLLAATAAAEPITVPINYEIDGTAYESVLIHADDADASRPGVLLVPNWLGINDNALARARELTDRYVVFVVDMYGKGTRPTDFEQAGAASQSALADRAVTRARIAQALASFREHGGDRLQADRIAAIGYCFGGTVALELARAGADVRGVVSIHGNPGPVLEPAGSTIPASVLVLHGADDAFVPEVQLRAFEQEMRDAGADWSLISYGGAKHCFAEPEANNTPPGCLFDATAARRSRQALDAFLAERLDR